MDEEINENVYPNFLSAMYDAVNRDRQDAEGAKKEEISVNDEISKKLLLFDACWATMRGPMKTKCYKWLLNSQVTSVEAERRSRSPHPRVNYPIALW